MPALLVLCLLPWGPAATELGAAALALWVLFRPDADTWPLAVPTLAFVALTTGPHVLMAPENIMLLANRLWPLVLLLALPRVTVSPRAINGGLWAAAAVGAWAGTQGLWGLLQGDPLPATGPFRHHLTLAFALVPAAAVALTRRRWGPAVFCTLGIVATGALGPLMSMGVVALALFTRPVVALAAGCAATIVLTGLLPADLLGARPLLWASGAEVMMENAIGVGAHARPALAEAQGVLSPGFHFPLHAHDAVLQAGVTGGVLSWVGLAMLGVACWKYTGVGGRTALAAVAVGALTQDTLGDLEVVRALCAWVVVDRVRANGK